MWICWALMLLMGILFSVSGNVKTEEQTEIPWYRVPVRRAAWFLAGFYQKGSPEERKKEAGKLETALWVLFLGTAAILVTENVRNGADVILESTLLDRPEKGEGEDQYTLYAKVGESGQEEPVQIHLQERQYTEKEKEELLEMAQREADEILVGENSSRDEIRGRVELPTLLQNGEVSVQWICDPEGLISSDGTITDDLPDEGQLLILTALMSCDGAERSYESALHLMPPLRTGEEEIAFELNRAVKDAQENSLSEKQVRLPTKVKGEQVQWLKRQESGWRLFLICILFLAPAGYAAKEMNYRKEEKNRSNQILLDYPDILFKLGMLLGAGLTIQNAFTKIAAEYQEMKKLQQPEKVRFAYEEMTAACNEMKSGVPEARAYENFGRRCRMPGYIRLGTVLAGGLQKSSEGLTDLLLAEARTAMEDRRQLARKLGEEAGTKLLFPMVVMLLVVLVILMVPAMMSF